jgi:hypothetical protein
MRHFYRFDPKVHTENKHTGMPRKTLQRKIIGQGRTPKLDNTLLVRL